MKVKEEDLRRELETALQGKDTQNNCARRIEIDSGDFRKLLGRVRIHGIDAVLHSNALYQYTDDFKLNVVNSVLSGEMPIRAAEREFNVNASVISSSCHKGNQQSLEFRNSRHLFLKSGASS